LAPQSPLMPGILQGLQKLTPDDLGERLNREQEVVSGCDPSFAIQTEPAPGYHQVQMGMQVEVLIPGVQDRSKADLGPQALIVPSQLQQSSRRGLKKQIVDEFRVAPGQHLEFMGRGDHQMEVMGGPNPLQALREPLGLLEALALGTVAVAAGVIGDGGVAATMAANVHVSAQTGGAAAFDIAHSLMLPGAEAMVLAVAWAVVAKDLGHIQGRSGHGATPVMSRGGSNPGGSLASGPEGR
jgi:hypothetical protein